VLHGVTNGVPKGGISEEYHFESRGFKLRPDFILAEVVIECAI
jgi:hypothetical protein